jgi:hypothetical protein
MGSTKTDWRRHLEGWQLLVVAGSIAVGAAVLAIPRAVAPRELPLPALDRREQRRFEHTEADRMARAELKPLPYPVRAAGEAFRRFGAAESASSDSATLEARQAEFAGSIAAARQRLGDEPVLALRAVQTALFARAVDALRDRGSTSRDLLELGGSFAARGEATGWVLRGRVHLTMDEAACVFRVRWNKLAGVQDTRPFSPTLDEWRLYYRTFIRHASPESPEVGGYVDALIKLDPEYPALLARGILAYWDARFAEATELFAAHLSAHPTGPWRLRAQNYLLAAYAHAPKS